MKVGTLVRYNAGGEKYHLFAVVTYVNQEGGTVKAVDMTGELHWLVTSYCTALSSLGKKYPDPLD